MSSPIDSTGGTPDHSVTFISMLAMPSQKITVDITKCENVSDICKLVENRFSQDVLESREEKGQRVVIYMDNKRLGDENPVSFTDFNNLSGHKFHVVWGRAIES